MFERLLTKPSLWEFVINVALAMFILLELNSFGWAVFSFVAAYILPFLAMRMFGNETGDHVLAKVVVVAGLLVLTIILDLSLSTGKTGMEAGANVSDKLIQWCEQEIPVDGYDEFNANARKCKELQIRKKNAFQSGADSTNGYLNVFGEDMPSWKVTLYSLFLTWFITFLMQLFFEWVGWKKSKR